MHKQIFLFCSLLLLACTNRTAAPANDSTSPAASSDTTGQRMSESEMAFLSGCVDNAKSLYGEAQAFALCKCILEQVQQKFPNADSATLITHLSDTTEVARMAQQCR